MKQNILTAAALLIVTARLTFADGDASQALQSTQLVQLQQQVTTLTQQLNTANQTLNTANQTLTQATQIVKTLGNPATALNSIGGLGQVGTMASGLQNSVGQLSSTINKSVMGLQTLASTGQGLYKAIPTTLPSGASILHLAQDYKPYEAHEAQQQNFATVLKQAIAQRNQILQDIKTTSSATPPDQSSQLAQQTKLNALNSELIVINAQVSDAHDQLTAQAQANQNDKDKQDQATRDADQADRDQMLKGYENSASRW